MSSFFGGQSITQLHHGSQGRSIGLLRSPPTWWTGATEASPPVQIQCYRDLGGTRQKRLPTTPGFPAIGRQCHRFGPEETDTCMAAKMAYHATLIELRRFLAWILTQWRGRLDVVRRQVYRAGEKAFVGYAGATSR